MHDVSVAEAASGEIVRRIGRKKVSEIDVSLELGALRFHDHRQVRFWIRELVRKELGDVRVRTSIREIEPEVSCPCGFRGAMAVHGKRGADGHHGTSGFACPSCGSADITIEKGNEFAIIRLSARQVPG